MYNRRSDCFFTWFILESKDSDEPVIEDALGHLESTRKVFTDARFLIAV